MLYYKKIDSIEIKENTVVTAGKFDGIHRGHQILFDKARDIAKEIDAKTCVFTFTRSPQAKLSHKKSVSIFDNIERKNIIEEFNMDILVECPFTDTIRNMEPEEFVRDLLIEKLNCKAIVVGTDFCFGKDRRGNPDFLLKTGPQFGIRVEVIDKLLDEGREISSTYVREELEKGNMPKVNELLGFPFSAEGEIVHGAHNGHLLGFPTANIIPDAHKLLPPAGVYSTNITVGGKTYKSITNIGVRPTFDGSFVSIETNIPGFHGDIYGKRAKVEFYEFTRPEKKFGSLEELKAQIRSDVASLGF